jgi:AraC family transcriptional regulator, positive regulator of tynA and feaB
MTTTLERDDLAAGPELGYEEWRAVVRSIVGRHEPEGIGLNAFAGRVLIRSPFGLCADLWDHNAPLIERRQRDVRLDDVEFYHAVFQVAGRSRILQNGQTVSLDVGDVALVDSTRPVSFATDAYAQFLSLQLPRRSLMSHLGLEPEGGSRGRRGIRAGRYLFQLVLDEFMDELTSDSSIYMRLAVYDLIGELFSPSDTKAVSLYTDKQFARVRTFIQEHFADPNLRPRDVAIAAGISLRYLQKLFTQRGCTCSGFIDSLRLDHAALLYRRRATARTRQPISEVAYASGFNDYNYFSKKFSRRFGCSPSAYVASSSPGDKTIVSASPLIGRTDRRWTDKASG